MAASETVSHWQGQTQMSLAQATQISTLHFQPMEEDSHSMFLCTKACGENHYHGQCQRSKIQTTVYFRPELTE